MKIHFKLLKFKHNQASSGAKLFEIHKTAKEIRSPHFKLIYYLLEVLVTHTVVHTILLSFSLKFRLYGKSLTLVATAGGHNRQYKRKFPNFTVPAGQTC